MLQVNENAVNILNSHIQSINKEQELSERIAAFQVLSLRVSVLIGKEFTDNMSGDAKVILETINEDMQSIQLGAIEALNSKNINKLETILASTKETAEYVFSDLQEYSELTKDKYTKGETELSSLVPWVIGELTYDDGLLVNYLQHLKTKQQQLNEKSNFDRSISLLSQQLQMTTDQVQNQADLQLQEASNGVRTVISGGQILLPALLIVFACLGFYFRNIIKKPLTEIINTLRELAKGNLTHSCQYKSSNEFGLIAEQINKTIDTQRAIIATISSKNAEILSISKDNHLQGSKLLNQSESQTAQCQIITQSMTEMNSSINDIATRAEEASSNVRRVNENVEESVGITLVAYEQNQQLSEQFVTANLSMKQVSESSASIFDILEVIDDITNQINLLALNAAIEAARAGDNGRGFAVVADEVRKLAHRTNSSTVKIQELIHALQTNIESATQQIDKCNETMKVNSESFITVQNKIDTVSRHVKSLSQLNEAISVATTQQTAASEYIASNMELILESAEQNYEANYEINKISDRLESITKEQVDTIKGFTI